MLLYEIITENMNLNTVYLPLGIRWDFSRTVVVNCFKWPTKS